MNALFKYTGNSNLTSSTLLGVGLLVLTMNTLLVNIQFIFVKTNKEPNLHYFETLRLLNDINKSKAMKETLRFTQFIIDHALTIILWLDSNGRFIYANEYACKILGYSYDKILSMTVHDIDTRFTKEDWPDRLNLLKETGSGYTESVFRHKDGSIIPVEVSSSHLIGSDDSYKLYTQPKCS